MCKYTEEYVVCVWSPLTFLYLQHANVCLNKIEWRVWSRENKQQKGQERNEEGKVVRVKINNMRRKEGRKEGKGLSPPLLTHSCHWPDISQRRRWPGWGRLRLEPSLPLNAALKLDEWSTSMPRLHTHTHTHTVAKNTHEVLYFCVLYHQVSPRIFLSCSFSQQQVRDKNRADDELLIPSCLDCVPTVLS